MANSMKPGGGGRFKKLTRGGMSSALAAWIGRRKYGRARFQKMAGTGRKRKGKGPDRSKTRPRFTTKRSSKTQATAPKQAGQWRYLMQRKREGGRARGGWRSPKAPYNTRT